MPHYSPRSSGETVLDWLSRFENRIGRRARRELKKVHGPRAVADFEERLKLIEPGDLCLDMGANVGTFTRRMAEIGCEVHAYEPDPVAWEALAKNVGDLPNVTLHNCAVAAQAGVFRLYRSRKFARDPLGSTVMSSIAFSKPSRFQDSDGIDVEVRAFGDIVRGFGRRIALVKMDIEGAEFDILRQIFADPGAFDIDALYCETHERQSYPEFAEIDRMRLASAKIDRPHINLYWP